MQVGLRMFKGSTILWLLETELQHSKAGKFRHNVRPGVRKPTAFSGNAVIC